MAYTEILHLTLDHAYFGNAVPPLMVMPSDPRGFDIAGCLLRQRGAIVTVLAADDVDERPREVALTLSAQNPQVIEVTKDAVWGAAASLTIPLDVDAVRLGDAETPEAPGAARRFDLILARLQIALPQAGRRDVTLRLDATDVLWAYHLTGSDTLDGLEIVDSTGDVTFEDLGVQDLVDGRPVRVIRSAGALAARARPSQRFALQKAGPFGPETLISVLPAAVPPFKPILQTGAPTRLQSDIFVTLW